jgi:hypothetical protein
MIVLTEENVSMVYADVMEIITEKLVNCRYVLMIVHKKDFVMMEHVSVNWVSLGFHVNIQVAQDHHCNARVMVDA